MHLILVKLLLSITAIFNSAPVTTESADIDFKLPAQLEVDMLLQSPNILPITIAETFLSVPARIARCGYNNFTAEHQELCKNYSAATQRSNYEIEHLSMLLNTTSNNNSAVNTTTDISLSIQLTIDRVYMLPLLSERWPGPVVLVLYGEHEDKQELQKFVLNSPPLANRSDFDYYFVNKFYSEEFYPTSLLRNTALERVKTRYAIPLDVDYLPRMGMYQHLQRLTAKFSAVNTVNNKTAFIIPAFWTALNSNMTKSQLMDAFPDARQQLVDIHWHKHGDIIPFATDIWPQAHETTNFSRWSAAATDEPYSIDYVYYYEPTVMFDTTVQPKLKFYEGIAGYFHDKGLLPALMAALGYKFLVVDNEFTIHVPHPRYQTKFNIFYRPPYVAKCQYQAELIFVNNLFKLNPLLRDKLDGENVMCF